MGRRIGELAKRIYERLLVWLGCGLILVLLDEYVKEGYVFNPGDVLNPAVVPSHEQIALCLAAALAVLVVRKVRRR